VRFVYPGVLLSHEATMYYKRVYQAEWKSCHGEALGTT